MGSIRMTGLFSNMDTESIIKEMMAAQETKKTKIVNKKVKLEWKQEIWKDLNTKLRDFTMKSLSKMRLEGSYKTKKATTTHDSLVSATAKGDAPSGSYSLTVDTLASAQKVTGASVSNLTTSSKLTASGVPEGTEIVITNGSGSNEKVKTLQVTADTTVNDFLNACTSVGLTASFDTDQGRFFISSKNSGASNSFTIKTSALSAGNISARNDIRNALNYNSLSTSNKNLVDDAFRILANDSTASAEQKQKAKDNLLKIANENDTAERRDFATKLVSSEIRSEIVARDGGAYFQGLNDTATKKYYETDANGNITATLKSDVKNNWLKAAEADLRKQATKKVEDDIANGAQLTPAQKQQEIEDEYKRLADKHVEDKAQSLIKNEVENKVQKEITEELKNRKNRIDTIVTNGLSASEITAANGSLSTEELTELSMSQAASLQAVNESLNGDGATKGLIEIYSDSQRQTTAPDGSITGTNALNAIGLDDITGAEITGGTGMAVIAAKDCKINLDGAILTSTTNKIKANGVELEIKGVPPAGEKISLNVSEDTDGTYNMVKDFIKEYNELLKEMNTMYNATSSKGYEPLSDDDKKAMTEKQIEQWESKIKDSLLRRDGTLDSITSAMRMCMGTTVRVDGKDYSLANLGISTSTDWTERGLLHIYGDEDDPIYGEETNKLKQMLNKDPDLVGKVIAGVTANLYKSLDKKMRVNSVSSAETFYNDIEMKNQLTTYKKDIKKWETKLTEMENRYYKQFSAMEVALSKLNSQSSYLSGLLG